MADDATMQFRFERLMVIVWRVTRDHDQLVFSGNDGGAELKGRVRAKASSCGHVQPLDEWGRPQ